MGRGEIGLDSLPQAEAWPVGLTVARGDWNRPPVSCMTAELWSMRQVVQGPLSLCA